MNARNMKKWINIAVVILILSFFAWNPLWMLEYRAQDSVFQRPGLLHPDIMVIGIDEHTLNELGFFHQWSRPLMAEAIEILNTYEDMRPAVIAINILYTEPGLIPEYDDALIKAAADAGNVVLASTLVFGFDPDTLTAVDIPLSHQRPFYPLGEYVRHGLVNATFDRDGVVRNALLRFPFGGDMIYSFALEVAGMSIGIAPDELAPQEINETLIRFAGKPGSIGDFFTFSFSDIFSNDFDPAWTTDAIVMIGAYSTGMMDHYPVPIDHEIAMYGVEIHANVVQQILEGEFIARIPQRSILLMVAFLLVATMFVSEFLSIRLTFVVLLITGAGYLFFAQWMFARGYLFPLLAPPLALILVFVYQLIYRHVLLTEERKRIAAELGIAAQIQFEMLPNASQVFPNTKGFDIHATMIPAKEIGGDFYDFFHIGDDKIAVVVADVSGKGVPAALFMVVAKTLLKSTSLEGKAPNEVFETVNDLLCENNETGMFVTAFMGVFDISTGKFTYVNAGHNPPLIRRATGDYEMLQTEPCLVFAIMEGMAYTQNEIMLSEGDTIYIYTDGVTEAANLSGELFEEPRLLEVVNKYKTCGVKDFLANIESEISFFAGKAEQADDITMLVLKIGE